MDLNRLELIGLGPVKNLLTKLGGWPVLEEDWNEELFEWWETNYRFRESGEFVIARAKKHYMRPPFDGIGRLFSFLEL